MLILFTFFFFTSTLTNENCKISWIYNKFIHSSPILREIDDTETRFNVYKNHTTSVKKDLSTLRFQLTCKYTRKKVSKRVLRENKRTPCKSKESTIKQINNRPFAKE